MESQERRFTLPNRPSRPAYTRPARAFPRIAKPAPAVCSSPVRGIVRPAIIVTNPKGKISEILSEKGPAPAVQRVRARFDEEKLKFVERKWSVVVTAVVTLVVLVAIMAGLIGAGLR